MSTGYQITEQNALHFLTFTIVDWVDLFTRKVYRDIVIDAFSFYSKARGLDIYGYVIMSNHVHALLHQPDGKLSDTIRDFKKYTARKIIEAVSVEAESRREWILHRFSWNASLRNNVPNYQVWTHDNHAVEIWSKKFFDQKLNYIHANPVRAGLVREQEEWIYSSAADLTIPLPLLPVKTWLGDNCNQEIADHSSLVGD
jgi:REP element-mobilizing transposase RayT